jgi:hypothetical protein
MDARRAALRNTDSGVCSTLYLRPVSGLMSGAWPKNNAFPCACAQWLVVVLRCLSLLQQTPTHLPLRGQRRNCPRQTKPERTGFPFHSVDSRSLEHLRCRDNLKGIGQGVKDRRPALDGCRIRLASADGEGQRMVPFCKVSNRSAGWISEGHRFRSTLIGYWPGQQTKR